MSNAPITCHVLDTVKGNPAENIQCRLFRFDGTNFNLIASAKTNKDGRINTWDVPLNQVIINDDKIQAGIYKIKFETEEYLKRNGQERAFFPFVEVVFQTSDPADAHYHIPLLLSNYSYSTYRGS